MLCRYFNSVSTIWIILSQTQFEIWNLIFIKYCYFCCLFTNCSYGAVVAQQIANLLVLSSNLSASFYFWIDFCSHVTIETNFILLFQHFHWTVYTVVSTLLTATVNRYYAHTPSVFPFFPGPLAFNRETAHIWRRPSYLSYKFAFSDILRRPRTMRASSQ